MFLNSYPNGWDYSGFFRMLLHTPPHCAPGLERDGTQCSGLYQQYPVPLTAVYGRTEKWDNKK